MCQEGALPEQTAVSVLEGKMCVCQPGAAGTQEQLNCSLPKSYPGHQGLTRKVGNSEQCRSGTSEASSGYCPGKGKGGSWVQVGGERLCSEVAQPEPRNHQGTDTTPCAVQLPSEAPAQSPVCQECGAWPVGC